MNKNSLVAFSRVRSPGLAADSEVDVRIDGKVVGVIYRDWDGSQEEWAADAQLEESLAENIGYGETLREAKDDVRAYVRRGEYG